MDQTGRDSLMRLAVKYIWWTTPELAIAKPDRVIAQVMEMGDYSDVQTLTDQFDNEILRDILLHAEIGQFSERS